MWDATKENLLLNGVSLLIAVGSLAMGVWTVLSDRVEGGLDDLFTVLVCLLLTVLFSISPITAVMKSGIIRRSVARKQPASEASAQPAGVDKPKGKVAVQ